MAFGTLKSKKQLSVSMVTRMRLVGDSAYQTGGTAGLAALIASRIKGHKHIAHISMRAPGYVGHYDHENDKLLVYQGGTEVAQDASLSSVTFDLTVFSA